MSATPPLSRSPWNAARLARFAVSFASLLVVAEIALRLLGWVQDEIGWALLDAGVPVVLARLGSGLAGGLSILIVLVALFAVFEWRQWRFGGLLPRYAEGVLYTATALVIATLIQTLAFAGLGRFAITPLLRAEQLGPLLAAFPLLYMLVIGFFEYWLHRALHAVPLLWRLHAVHHQIEGLNAARSYSHWAQDALYFAVITVPLVFLIDQPHQTVTLLTTLYLVSNYYMHSDSPGLSFPPWLRHVLADNLYHHYHHSRQIEHWGRNYCSFFSFYDRLFGTQHLPADETFHPTGIAGYRPIGGWRDYCLRPFLPHR